MYQVDSWMLDFLDRIVEVSVLSTAQERTLRHIELNVFGGRDL